MTASIEDYLEGIYDLTGSGGPVIGARLARHLKVSPPAVTEALQRMTRDGYLRIGPGKQIVLTKRGRALAAGGGSAPVTLPPSLPDADRHLTSR
jgi:Mn-dependent DtxR family transcriptional regulator